MNNAVSGINYGECDKTYRNKTCHNRKKKELFSIKRKFSY